MANEPKQLNDLKDAPKNPRTITEEALAGLKDSLYVFGDLSGFVWNEKTGNVVCGHQRKRAMTELLIKLTDIEWSKPYEVEVGSKVNRFKSQEQDGWFRTAQGARFRVRRVNWPDAFEKAANVAANDERIQGVFDVGLLSDILGDIENGMPDVFKDFQFAEINVDNLINPEDVDSVNEDTQPRLDKKHSVTCPECGHEFQY